MTVKELAEVLASLPARLQDCVVMIDNDGEMIPVRTILTLPESRSAQSIRFLELTGWISEEREGVVYREDDD